MERAVEADGFVVARLPAHKKDSRGAAACILGRQVGGVAVDVEDHVGGDEFDGGVGVGREVV